MLAAVFYIIDDVVSANNDDVVVYPLARREAPDEGRRPAGDGANFVRCLVPYHGKCKRIQSRIESIYLFIPSPGAKRRPRPEGPRARVLISTGV